MVKAHLLLNQTLSKAVDLMVAVMVQLQVLLIHVLVVAVPLIFG